VNARKTAQIPRRDRCTGGAMTEIRWTLAGFVDVIRCELAEAPAGYALGLRMGDELILAELWPNVEQAPGTGAERLFDSSWTTLTPSFVRPFRPPQPMASAGMLSP
jgi:hypothetical protein